MCARSCAGKPGVEEGGLNCKYTDPSYGNTHDSTVNIRTREATWKPTILKPGARGGGATHVLGEPLAVGEAAGALVGVEPVLGVDRLLVGLEVLSVSAAGVALEQHRVNWVPAS